MALSLVISMVFLFFWWKKTAPDESNDDNDEEEEKWHEEYCKQRKKQIAWTIYRAWFRHNVKPGVRQWRFRRLCSEIEKILELHEHLMRICLRGYQNKLDTLDNFEFYNEWAISLETTTDRRVRLMLADDEDGIAFFMRHCNLDKYDAEDELSDSYENKLKVKRLTNKISKKIEMIDADEEERDFLDDDKTHRRNFRDAVQSFRTDVVNLKGNPSNDNYVVYVERKDRKTKKVRKSREIHRKRLEDLQKSDKVPPKKALKIRPFENRDDYSPDPITRRKMEEDEKILQKRMILDKRNGHVLGEVFIDRDADPTIRMNIQEEEQQSDPDNVKSFNQLNILLTLAETPLRREYYKYLEQNEILMSLEDYLIVKEKLERPKLRAKIIKEATEREQKDRMESQKMDGTGKVGHFIWSKTYYYPTLPQLPDGYLETFILKSKTRLCELYNEPSIIKKIRDIIQSYRQRMTENEKKEENQSSIIDTRKTCQAEEEFIPIRSEPSDIHFINEIIQRNKKLKNKLKNKSKKSKKDEPILRYFTIPETEKKKADVSSERQYPVIDWTIP